MSEAPTWQAAFVATTYALGDTVQDARASLGPGDLAVAAAVLTGLAHTQREVRARILASALGRIVADIEVARVA
jgi:hypothetical protein